MQGKRTAGGQTGPHLHRIRDCCTLVGFLLLLLMGWVCRRGWPGPLPACLPP